MQKPCLKSKNEVVELHTEDFVHAIISRGPAVLRRPLESQPLPQQSLFTTYAVRQRVREVTQHLLFFLVLFVRFPRELGSFPAVRMDGFLLLLSSFGFWQFGLKRNEKTPRCLAAGSRGYRLPPRHPAVPPRTMANAFPPRPPSARCSCQRDPGGRLSSEHEVPEARRCSWELR